MRVLQHLLLLSLLATVGARCQRPLAQAQTDQEPQRAFLSLRLHTDSSDSLTVVSHSLTLQPLQGQYLPVPVADTTHTLLFTVSDAEGTTLLEEERSLYVSGSSDTWYKLIFTPPPGATDLQLYQLRAGRRIPLGQYDLRKKP